MYRISTFTTDFCYFLSQPISLSNLVVYQICCVTGSAFNANSKMHLYVKCFSLVTSSKDASGYLYNPMNLKASWIAGLIGR